MKMIDFIERLKKILEMEESGELDYYYVGVRFEDKQREIGEELPPSKYNDDREDERDFPDFNDEGYEDLPDAGGASAWGVEHALEEALSIYTEGSLVSSNYGAKHCYIIVGDYEGHNLDHVLDHGEVVIKDAKVFEQLF